MFWSGNIVFIVELCKQRKQKKERKRPRVWCCELKCKQRKVEVSFVMLWRKHVFYCDKIIKIKLKILINCAKNIWNY